MKEIKLIYATVQAKKQLYAIKDCLIRSKRNLTVLRII